MSDVFISYARSTEAEAHKVAKALRALGYGVWRDDELPAHRSFSEVIEERLKAAKAVVVIWSAEAVKSEWVQSEADRARTDRKLVQLSVDGTPLPMPFDRIQCADLTGWSGDIDAAGWKKVAGSIADLVGGGGQPAAAPGPTPARATHRASICVLPFANMSGDAEQEYFSDGISEDIVTDLSKVSALSVVARNTAFRSTWRAPAHKQLSVIALRSTAVAPEGTPTTTFGLKKARPWRTRPMKARIISSATRKSATTPSRKGRQVVTSRGVRPTISFARAPTALTTLRPPALRSATTEGSFSAIP
jgi:adenylate cyclase